jgi:DNA-binding response OmpR family regulator
MMGKTILAIDDEMTNRLVIEHILGKKFRVVTLESGEQAFEWLQENELPDCIITDLSMPGMDGFEVIRRARGDRSLARIPVIVLSSKDSSADRIQCLKLGADDYVVKPFNAEELEARLESLFRRLG